jgi:hypothetical protein
MRRKAYSHTRAANKPLWFERHKRLSAGQFRQQSQYDKWGLRRSPDGGGRFFGGNNFNGESGEDQGAGAV